MKYKQSRSNKYGGYVTGLGTHMEERGKLLIDRRNKMSKQLKIKKYGYITFTMMLHIK